MSDVLGTVTLENDRQASFLQTKEPSYGTQYSEETAREIDQEDRNFIDNQTKKVSELLTKLKPILLEAAQKLLDKETATGDDLRLLMEGGKEKPCCKQVS